MLTDDLRILEITYQIGIELTQLPLEVRSSQHIAQVGEQPLNVFGQGADTALTWKSKDPLQNPKRIVNVKHSAERVMILTVIPHQQRIVFKGRLDNTPD